MQRELDCIVPTLPGASAISHLLKGTSYFLEPHFAALFLIYCAQINRHNNEEQRDTEDRETLALPVLDMPSSHGFESHC